MKFTLLFATLFGVLLATQQSLTVSTPIATYEGFDYTGNIQGFVGIQYADAPVGNLRFAPPVAFVPNDPMEVLNATIYPLACRQLAFPIPGIEPVESSEDCLYINVFRPSDFTGQLPVHVEIHDGGWVVNSNAVGTFPPDFYLPQENVIFVSFNYRLNVYGYMSLTNYPANVGVMDQQMALKWVSDYIADFGGDTTKMFIGGHSGGGAAALTQPLLIPRPSSLGYRAIMSRSGAPTYFPEFNKQEVGTLELAAILGCPTSSPADTISCLRSTTVEDLDFAVLFTSRPLNYFIPSSGPQTQFPSRMVKMYQDELYDTELNFILGTATEEGEGFMAQFIGVPEPPPPFDITEVQMEVLTGIFFDQIVYVDPTEIAGIVNFYKNYAAENNVSLWKAASLSFGDGSFTGVVDSIARALNDHNSKVWVYSFSHAGDNFQVEPTVGATHGTIEQFAWGKPIKNFLGQNYTEREQTFSEEIMGFMGSIAKRGRPTPVFPIKQNWPRFSENFFFIPQNITLDMRPHYDPPEDLIDLLFQQPQTDRFAFWEQVLAR